MATMNIWWHEANAPGTYGHINLRREPEISKTTVTTSGTAAASSAAPSGTAVAILRSTVATNYRVSRKGTSTDATSADKVTDADAYTEIACQPGDTISFIE